MTAVPHNREVEAGLIGRLLRDPVLIGQVAGTLLLPRHFYDGAHRLLYETILERFFAGEPVEAVVIGEHKAKALMRAWAVDEPTAIARVQALAAAAHAGAPDQAAELVKRDADYRELLKLADSIRDQVQSEDLSPEEIAGITGQGALELATHRALTHEIVSLGAAGRTFVTEARQAMKARSQGIELGAYYGLTAIDEYTNGHKPGELIMAGGEPGVGKSAVWWKAALNFAGRQALRPEGEQVGTLVISLEMGPSTSNARLASMMTGVSGTAIRTGNVSERDLGVVIDAWRERKDMPLWLNYAPTLRASQLRALVSEGIRRHNVGVVVIDHFRMWDLDKRLPNKVDEDEEKVRFLKEQLALPLNVAVICLAHTRKPDPASNGRPKMSDLRGSYQVAAHSDFVSFIYRPSMYATQKQKDSGEIRDDEAEMIWAKNRHGNPGTGRFRFDAGRMFIVN